MNNLITRGEIMTDKKIKLLKREQSLFEHLYFIFDNMEDDEKKFNHPQYREYLRLKKKVYAFIQQDKEKRKEDTLNEEF